jgi:DNA-binding LacI/PurR family transcriptional regulator
VRIADVARIAGVSPTTVSHAINGKGRVGAQTRRRVLEVAKQLGYRADRNAVNLTRRRSGVIALTVSSPAGMSVGLTDLEFFVRFVNGATTEALELGYALVLVPPRGAFAFDAIAVDGGILIDPLVDDALLIDCDNRGIPVVTSGRDPSGTHPAWVDNDLVASSRVVLEHLHERGARRIGLVAPPPIYSYGLDYRLGYEEWCAAHGCEPLIVEAEGALTETAGYTAAMSLLERADRPDAIYATLDRYALGTLLAAEALGLSVPAELLVASGIDSDLVRAASPSITALRLHPEECGRRAVVMLTAQIEDPSRVPEPSFVPTDLVVRASTAEFASAASAHQPHARL